MSTLELLTYPISQTHEDQKKIERDENDTDTVL